MIARTYIDFCETLWSDWCASRLTLPTGPADCFQLDYAPEPYLRFGEGTKPFCVLFTNPGAGMPHQRRELVMSGKSCMGCQMPYREASIALAEFYKQLPSGHAKRNIEAMDHIRQVLGADCIIQFESLPFHSGSLPRKAEIPYIVERTEILNRYASVLAGALKNLSVMALSAVSSRRPISKSSVSDSPWLLWQASLLGIVPARLTLIPLVETRGNTTSAFLCQRSPHGPRGFVLTMGGNTFPGTRGQEILAHALSSAL
jgi:hypothetical protein